MNHLFSPTLIAAWLVVATPALAQVHPVPRVIEAHASSVVLPASADGTLVVRSCQECTARTLQATAATRYRLGESDVSLGEFGAFLRDHPYITLTVSYREGTNVVIGLQAYPPAADR